jgi:tRNA-dihydrouridine synthase C
MLGRGIVTNPGLGLAIQAFDAGQQHVALSWQELLPHLGIFWGHIAQHISPRHQAGRFKQWLNFLRKHYPDAEVAYQELRTLTEPQRIEDWLLVSTGGMDFSTAHSVQRPAALCD